LLNSKIDVSGKVQSQEVPLVHGARENKRIPKRETTPKLSLYEKLKRLEKASAKTNSRKDEMTAKPATPSVVRPAIFAKQKSGWMLDDDSACSSNTGKNLCVTSLLLIFSR